MTNNLKRFIGEIATLASGERNKESLKPYLNLIKNISYIYPIDKKRLVKYFNKSLKNAQKQLTHKDK